MLAFYVGVKSVLLYAFSKFVCDIMSCIKGLNVRYSPPSYNLIICQLFLVLMFPRVQPRPSVFSCSIISVQLRPSFVSCPWCYPCCPSSMFGVLLFFLITLDGGPLAFLLIWHVLDFFK